MLSAIKLVVSENGKLLDTVTKETNTQTEQLIISLEEFQRSANEVLTKLIQKNGDEDLGTLDEFEDNEEEAENDKVSPKKKKK